MNSQAATNQPNGATPAHELFALTDEQILEIEPVAVNDAADVEQPLLADSKDKTIRDGALGDRPVASTQSSVTAQSAQAGVPVLPADPPAWLARQMKDPWVGDEARELWDSVLRAQAEAAEYRAAIASPAEAKSLKEIYPGGVEQARAASERARALDEFDAAYFGVAGKSAEEIGVARRALAQRMLREDPAAFREMVAAGVKALEQAENARNQKTVAQAFRPEGVSATEGSAASDRRSLTPEGVSYNEMAQRAEAIAGYGAFEKAANAELEKSVGGAIERTLRQALPNLQTREEGATAGARTNVPLQERLASAVRQEIEKALQGDRQLGEQVAQVLSARRFDETARSQVVRLINERAQQLVPSATKRVLNDWTQTTMATHRAKTEKQESASRRADLAPAQQGRVAAERGTQQRSAARADTPPPPRGRIDYKKLSDEQILEL